MRLKSFRYVAWIAAGAFLALLSLYMPAIAEVSAAQPLGWLAETIEQRGILVSLIAVFLGGLALNLTPCVYPLIPVTLAFFGGQATGRTSRTFFLALSYVLGLAISYAILGVLAAQSGALLGSWLQQPMVLVGVASLIIALALSMFGLYEFRPPQALMRRFGQAQVNIPGAFIMGFVVGVIAAPCIGPFLLGLFLFVGHLADVTRGFLIFFVLGLGMGTPYIFLALAVNRVNQLPKAGAWLVWIKKVLGCVLVGLSLYLLMPIIPDGAFKYILAGLLLGSGVYLGWLEQSESPNIYFTWSRWALGVILITFSMGIVWPRPSAQVLVSWEIYTEDALDEARRSRVPVVIDIYADWCLPCVELDHVTFRHPDVVSVLNSMSTLRLDVTEDVSDDGQRLIEQYRVYGVPTVLLFDRSGDEFANLRLLGFVSPKAFLKRLKAIQ